MKVKKRYLRESKREGRGIYLLPLLFFFCFIPFYMSQYSEREKETLMLDSTPGQVWVMQKRIWGNYKIAMEEYLVGMMAATIPGEYEMETLKAQAILLRSFCMSQMVKEDGKKVVHDVVVKDYYFNEKQRNELWKDNITEYENKVRQAVKETKGMFLVCGEDVINPPFFRLSNGVTRDVTEYVLSESKYPYMKSVACEKDIMAENYIQYVEMTDREFEKQIKKLMGKKGGKLQKLILYKDENGYVKEVEVNSKKIKGEAFRQAFGLASSSFSLEKIDSMIEIQTKGIGHGFGFSQWEANCLAKEGRNYEELLQYFFENISVEKI